MPSVPVPSVTPAPGGIAADSGMPALPGDDVRTRQRLPRRTRTYWQVRAAVTGVVVVGLLIWGALGLDWFDPAVRWSVVGFAAAWFLVVAVWVRPVIRHRLFWFSLSDGEIDLQHGWLVRVRTVVPMSRVQHLKTEQGLLERRFTLADLHIHTAAGAVVMHGLDQVVADDVRRRIGLLAQLDDEI